MGAFDGFELRRADDADVLAFLQSSARDESLLESGPCTSPVFLDGSYELVVVFLIQLVESGRLQDCIRPAHTAVDIRGEEERERRFNLFF